MTKNLRLPCYASLVLLVMTAVSPAQQPTPPAPSDPFAVLAAKEPQELAAGGVRVVVQKPDGTPAPDAIVVFTPWRDDEAARAEREAALQRFPADEPRRFALLAANGTRYRVDERGATRVPKQGHVFAFADDVVARHYVSEDTPEPRIVLQLAMPQTIAVDVVTADGKPAAGVPFALRDAPRHSSDPEHTTGADGTATLRLLRTRPDTALVELQVATQSKLQAPLPANATRVRLQLPPTTAIDATFAGDLVPGAQLDWQLQCGENAPTVAGQRTGERSARWPFVEVGATFRAAVKSSEIELAATTGEAKSTKTLLSLVRSTGAATLAMQLLDPDGQPVRRVVACLRWEQPYGNSADVARTNANGWFEVAIPTHMLDRSDVAVTLHCLSDHGQPAIAVGKVGLRATAAERVELPPLRCNPPPALVAGTVVALDGTPLPGLVLQVSAPYPHRVTTDAQGRFTVVGIGQGNTVRVSPPAGWLPAEEPMRPVALPEGSTGVRLVMQRAARVRFASDMPNRFHSAIHYYLEPASGRGPKVRLGMLGPRELIVPPGHWHFVAAVGAEELLRLPDLHCESGVETHDPRFMAFDWRAYATLVEITVRDDHGAPSDECLIWLWQGKGGSGCQPTGGVARLLLPKGGASVSIEPRDKKFAKVNLGVVTEDQVVVLGGGPPMTLKLAPMPKLPEGVEIVVAVGDNAEVPFDAMGTAIVVLPKAGSYTPTIALKRNGNLSPLDWKLAAVDVPANGAKVAIEVTPARQKVLELWLPKPTPK